jgi:hypothetical protein
VTILIYTVIQKYLVGGTNIYFAVLIVGFIVFAVLSLIFVVFNEDLKEKKAKLNPILKHELAEQKDTAKLLEEKPFEPAASVTENSTELLLVKNRTKKFE